MLNLFVGNSIKQRIIRYFLAIVFFVVLVNTILTVTKTESVLKNAQEDKATNVTKNLAVACSDPMMSIAYADPMMSGESDRLTKNLEEVKKSDQGVVYVILTSNDGKCVASSQSEFRDRYLNSTDYEKKVLEAKEFMIAKNPEGKSDFEAVMPVVAASQKMGVLRIGYTTKYITSTVVGVAVLIVFIGILLFAGGSFIFYVMVEKGIITPLNQVMVVAQKIAEGNLSQQKIGVVSKDEIGRLADIFNNMIDQLRELVTRAEFIANGIIGADAVEEKLEKGLSLSAASSYEEEAKGDLSIAFGKMQAELRKLTIQARRISTDDLNNPVLDEKIIGELGEAFNQMTYNLKELAKVAERIASNDLTASVVIHSQKDVLANAFYKMVTNLKNLIGIVVQLANTTHNSASAMAETTKQVNQTMDQVQNSIQQIASATNQVAKSTQEISILMRNASSAVSTGSDNINKVIDKFGSVQTTIENTGMSINKLEQRSQEISEIVGLITKIADQTNLLALNAAIEAARAGEAGRGFAVVADEVRKLAESSGSSAEKISQIIKEIQTDMTGVVSSSQNSLEEAKVVLDLANRMQEGYKDIVDSIKAMSQQVEQIAAISEETAASAEEITAGAEEQTAAVTEIANNSKILVDQVNKLKVEVNKFRL
ncbi:MAG: HAMP domain-containing protein [Endomicrobiales bacterium]|nr:HAMP domain-containing protein [Endomicrobiales bacterium]